MKIMIRWKMHPGKLHDTLAAFSAMTPEQEQALMGDHVKLIGRWHDLVRGTGVAIYEADDVAAISHYSLHWNQHMDLDISVVVDDEETRQIGQQRAAGS
jgi:hypothetical protein